ncbi:MAG: YicC family protein [Chitinophagales bacterium]|nr:YicC family protein [Chitinophagales bacterium]
MVLSMTGYGRKTFELNGKNIVIEIKSLNSKAFDLNLRLPNLFREGEVNIRNIISRRILRGKIDCIINFENNEDQKNGELNPTAVKEYYRQLKNIADELQLPEQNIFDLVFRLPNVTTSAKEELTEEQWSYFLQMVESACDQLEQFRKDEGVNLATDLSLHNHGIEDVLIAIEKIDPERMQHQRDKLLSDLKKYVPDEVADMNRFEQELIYYLEKMDITEEVIRLRSHCMYFIETIEEITTEKGKKLGFICQEMGREINTIGSKAYHADMQRCVVMMKDELEKIKEQLNNVL